MTIAKNINNAIAIVYEKMLDSNIEWAVIGSASLALQGMDLEPRDLDIIIKKADMQKTRGAFADFLISDIKDLKEKYEREVLEILLDISGVEVQILGGDENGIYAKSLFTHDLARIDLDNRPIPCRPLASEAEAYEKTGRKEKADLIRNYLKQIIR